MNAETKSNLVKYTIEFIGTFFLVLTVGCVLLLKGQGVIAPIAIGFALMIMVYAGGPISGGHFNPAVSFSAAIAGALSWKHFVPYIIAQFLGGTAAAYTAVYLAGSFGAQVEFYQMPLFAGEMLFTFALCYVVLMTAVCFKAQPNSYFGLAIGSTVTVGAFAVGAICFAAFNPAIALSLLLMKFAAIQVFAVTIAANFIAAIIAALVYKFAKSEC